MVDVRRKGSLAWYHNSKRGLTNIIPSIGKQETTHGYYVKIKMDQEVVDGVLTPYTLLKQVALEKVSDDLYTLKLSEIGMKRTHKKDVNRVIHAETELAIKQQLENCTYVDAISLTKGKGTEGPVKRRNLKKGKRKAKSSNCSRAPGSMGLRGPGKVDWRRPFMGKMGNSRRTIYNLKVLGHQDITDLTSHKFFSATGRYLKVKGSISGPLGRVTAIRPAIRKLTK